MKKLKDDVHRDNEVLDLYLLEVPSRRYCLVLFPGDMFPDARHLTGMREQLIVEARGLVEEAVQLYE